MSDNGKRYAEQILATVSQPIVAMTGELQVEVVNDAFCRTFAVTAGESENRRLYDLGNGQWDIPELRRLLGEVLNKQNAVRDYRVEHDFEGIGKRIMLLNARRMARDGEGQRIVLAINDITEIEAQRNELEGRIEFSEKLINSVRESLLILHWDLRVHSANQTFYEKFRVSRRETNGRMVYDLGNGQWNIPELRRLLEDVLPQQEIFDDYEIEHDFDGIGRRVMLLNGRRLDHLDLIILAIRDVTEQRRNERRQQTLMGELQHRVKNILNNVRSLATQTRRRSPDLDHFFNAFMPRLAALSRAQDLLLKSPCDDVDLPEIVRVELEAVGAEEGRTYTTEGPSLRLTPRDSQAIAMAIHELATNAGKYGALSAEGGGIDVAWRIDGQGNELHLRWREHGVRIGDPTMRRGFGSDVIEKAVPHMLGGTAELTFKPDGAECRIVFPLPEKGP